MPLPARRPRDVRAYRDTGDGLQQHDAVLYSATRNPWDPQRRARGSSGGAGAAVVAGVVPIADAAAGSIRVPAAYNGLFGLKPTRGRVSAGPDFDKVFNSLAVQVGVSRTVRDSAALLDGCAAGNRATPTRATSQTRVGGAASSSGRCWAML
ncbi:hypothetical protein GCM10010094_00560 [Streptomyces flaveus]|uniref:Amidase domain-containing protein n=1 Tax=Streptomyces flaveus TaxID=66370 RepID=A0A917QEC2_9ACTN|nr:amidase family protein [Streptomyces flaveus]GGK44740.1 hypothetical protein GCM10010094_00560 [Streptomyces flaveus]